MEIPRSLLDELTREVNALSGAARQQAGTAIANVLSEWDGEDVTALRTATIAVLDGLLPTYTDLSAARAAEFYDAARSAQNVRRRYEAVAKSQRDAKGTEGAVRAIVEYARKGDGERFRREIASRVDTEVRRAANECVAYNAGRDPAKPRYARVPSGDTCEFCLMLASRGYVYTSESNASHAHRNCDCRVVPSFNGNTVEGYDPEALLERWHAFEEINAMEGVGDFDKRALKSAYTRGREPYDHALKAVEGYSIAPAKLERYALSPYGDADKARAFEGYLGYTVDDAAEVASLVYSYVADHAPEYRDTIEHGKRYTTNMVMGGKDGRSAKVRVGWIKDEKTGKLRLTAIFVDE